MNGTSKVDPFDWSYAESPDISEPVYLFATIYMVIIGTFGILTNGGVIGAFIKGSSEIRSPYNFVLMNVIFNEFVVSVYGIPIDITSIAMRGYHFGFETCISTGFIHTTAGMTSLYTLMGLSIERWLVITHQGKFSLNSLTATSVIIGSSWILGLLTSVPPLLGWAYYAPETSGISCTPAWEDPANFHYTWCLMIIGFLVPLIIILYTSIKVIYKLHEHSKKIASKKSNRMQKEHRASLMVILMIVGFMISWFPYTIICFVKMAGLNVTPTISAFPLLFAKSSTCWNPIIYVFLNDQFCKALLPSCLKRIWTRASKKFTNNKPGVNMENDKPLESDNHILAPKQTLVQVQV